MDPNANLLEQETILTVGTHCANVRRFIPSSGTPCARGYRLEDLRPTGARHLARQSTSDTEGARQK